MEKSYWNENGKYQDVFDVLWSKWVPQSGESIYRYGEIVRGIGRLGHEYYNNGNCNAKDGREVSEMFEHFLQEMERHIPNIHTHTKAVRKLIVGHKNYNYDYDDKEEAIYNDLFDKCLEFLIEEQNINLEEYKLEAIKVKIEDKMSTADFYKNKTLDNQMELQVALELGNDEDIEKLNKAIDYNSSTSHKYEMEASKLRLGYIKLKTNMQKVCISQN